MAEQAAQYRDELRRSVMSNTHTHTHTLVSSCTQRESVAEQAARYRDELRRGVMSTSRMNEKYSELRCRLDEKHKVRTVAPPADGVRIQARGVTGCSDEYCLVPPAHEGGGSRTERGTVVTRYAGPCVVRRTSKSRTAHLHWVTYKNSV